MGKIILGIDPGNSGGLAIITESDGVVPFVMPVLKGKKTTIDLQSVVDIMWTFIEQGKDRIAVIEKVHSMPKQGGASIFSFGYGYGAIIGILTALKIPYLNPTPQQWKKVVREGTNKDKIAAINFVKNRYPDVDMKPGKKTVDDDGIADAVCLAYYAKIKENIK